MAENPYQSPEESRAITGWRLLWKRLCLGGLALAIASLLAGKAIEEGFPRAPVIVILIGLFALVALVSFTIAGVAGIGWVLTRHRL